MSENNFWDECRHILKKADMKQKIQQTYDHFVKLANFNFEQSGLKLYSEFQDILLSKAEAFESAAEYLARMFIDEIIETTTMRFNSIREHHLEENTDEPKEIIES